MVIRVYWASVTGNRKISGDQSRLKNLIESLKLESTWIDVTTSRSVMNQMRMECGNSKALPPQIFLDDVHLGDVDELNERVEDGSWKAWLSGNKDNVTDNNQTTEENICNQNNSNNEKSTTQVLDESVHKYNPSEEIKMTSSTSVSSAVSSFENINNTSPKISRKIVQLQLATSEEEQKDAEKAKMDEERRRRILGLPPADENGEADVKCLQDKTNESISETKVIKDIDSSKIKSIYDVENTTS